MTPRVWKGAHIGEPINIVRPKKGDITVRKAALVWAPEAGTRG